MSKLAQKLTLFFLITLLTACDSSSDDSSTDSNAYFKFYNASPNSSSSRIYLDETSYSIVDFSKVSVTYALTSDDYELSVTRDDIGGDEIEVIQETIDLQNETMSVFILTGDIDQPEIIEFNYDTSTLEDLALDDDDEGDEQFELYIGNFATNSSGYDVYLSLADEDFSQAQLVATVNNQSFSDKILKPQEEYILYLTEPGSSEVIFQTSTIYLNYLETFMLVIRDNFGPSNLAVDRITSGSVISSYLDIDAETEIQFYNSNQGISAVDIYLDNTNSEPMVENLESGQLSNELLIDKGTYTINTTITGQAENYVLRNLLLNLNEGESKTVVLYTDSDAQAQGIAFSQHTRPLAYENSLTVVNLASEEDTIDIYFVENDETINSTDNYIKSVDFAEPKKLSLVQQEYQIYITTEDDNGSERLLYQSAPMTLDANENYIIFIEPDVEEFSGYTINIIKE
ncbi:DUF4397 domain-containing protein [Aliikangiella coralliicola]|uniref:DUF4397 domain-containing protein n=1 Tax=Aliikangiella coralliicola TaxID=2592383 RepID=A0A545U7T5_9GAMM|nr:DUF4397 domain-containing protein [Aliikangiella coralliicola]TQV85526.1 DUF4397 domain-containing protein [Aliikangiella coralliicola]